MGQIAWKEDIAVVNTTHDTQRIISPTVNYISGKGRFVLSHGRVEQLLALTCPQGLDCPCRKSGINGLHIPSFDLFNVSGEGCVFVKSGD